MILKSPAPLSLMEVGGKFSDFGGTSVIPTTIRKSKKGASAPFFDARIHSLFWERKSTKRYWPRLLGAAQKARPRLTLDISWTNWTR
jgi:hypothetical protein